MGLKNITRLEFIEALESGTFTQTYNQAVDRHKDKCFCALGVAMYLKGYEITPGERKHKAEDFAGFIVPSYDVRLVIKGIKSPLIAENDYITQELADDLEIDDATVEEVIAMNDGDRASFSDIAEYLRNKWNLPKNEQVHT